MTSLLDTPVHPLNDLFWPTLRDVDQCSAAVLVRPPGTVAAAGTWPDAVVDVLTVSTEWLEPSPRRDGPPGTSSEARCVESTYDAVLATETATSPAGREPVPYVAKALRGNGGMPATLELMGAVLEV